MRVGRYFQLSGEKIRYQCDCSAWLAGGEYIVGLGADNNPFLQIQQLNPLVLPRSTQFEFYVSGGQEGQEYRVVISVQTTLGQVRQFVFTFQIEDEA